MLRIYARRRQSLAEALGRELGTALSFTQPQGGLALWVNFAPHIDVGALAAAGARHGVGILPGQAFATDRHKNNGVRLGFGSLDEVELQEAVRRLKAALRE